MTFSRFLYTTYHVTNGRGTGGLVDTPMGQRSYPENISKLHLETLRTNRWTDMLSSFRLAALRPFGDPAKSDDWDIFEVPKITVLPGGTIGQS